MSSNIEYQHTTVSTPIKRDPKRLKPFLSSCVPNLTETKTVLVLGEFLIHNYSLSVKNTNKFTFLLQKSNNNFIEMIRYTIWPKIRTPHSRFNPAFCYNLHSSEKTSHLILEHGCGGGGGGGPIQGSVQVT